MIKSGDTSNGITYLKSAALWFFELFAYIYTLQARIEKKLDEELPQE